MEHSFYIESNNGNFYHFDTRDGLFSLIHPVLFYIHKLYYKGENKQNILQTLSNEFPSIDVGYYFNYYEWLENNSKEIPIDHFIELKPDMVKDALSNLNQLTFEVTDVCNLKCKYCGYGELYDNYDKRTNNYLSVDIAKKLIDYLYFYWNKPENISGEEPLFISFYGGEPLLNMSLIKSVVSIFEELNIKRTVIFSMTTNAILLNKYIDYLKEHHFRILISLDGTQYNNSYRVFADGKESFDIVYNNVKYAYQKYPDFFKTNINFNSVFHNKNTAYSIVSFFKKEFNKTPTIGELNTNGIKDNKKEEFKHTFQNLQYDIENSKRRNYLEKKLFLTSPMAHSFILFAHHYNKMTYDNYNELFRSDGNATIDKLPSGTCIPFSKKLFLTVNGKILPCERIGQKHCLGEVKEEGVHLDIDDICRQYNQWFRTLSRHCKTCYINKVCMQCIFNLGSIDKKIYCTNYMDKQDFETYLKKMATYMEEDPNSYRKAMKEILMR